MKLSKVETLSNTMDDFDEQPLRPQEAKLIAKWRKRHPKVTEKELEDGIRFLRSYVQLLWKIFERQEQERQQ